MLILLGALNLRVTMRTLQASASFEEHYEHVHRHGDYAHTHAHGHGDDAEAHGHRDDAVPPARLDRIFGRVKWYRAVRPIVIGIVRGLAGSAAVALLVLPVIQRPVWALTYLLVFGLGTIAGMMLMTATIAVPVTYSAPFLLLASPFCDSDRSAQRRFGLFLAYQIGFVDGLFTN